MMENTLLIPVTARDGWIHLDESHKRIIAAWCRNREGKKVSLRLSPHRKPRSTPQLRLYFGVVVEMIADYTNNSKEAVHDALKSMFLGPEIVQLGSKEIVRQPTTTTLSSERMTKYINDCVVFAHTELGLAIPLEV